MSFYVKCNAIIEETKQAALAAKEDGINLIIILPQSGRIYILAGLIES